MRPEKSSWDRVGAWYDDITGKEGHYYHKEVILPKLRPHLTKGLSRLLDIGCGQGVLSRAFPDVDYVGVDIAPSLIAKAKERSPKETFIIADASQPLPVEGPFSHAVSILALQNIAEPGGAIDNAARLLEPGGKLILVLNHPCFRIPRQSSWGVDEAKKWQYRRVDRYMSPLSIPIDVRKEKTWSFHLPLSALVTLLTDRGFLIEGLEEWCSNKESSGGSAKRENAARKEFPLFLMLVARLG